MDPVTGDLTALAPAEPPRPATSGAGDWVRRNLFRSVGDGIVTVVAAVVIGYVLFRLGRYVFVTGRWEIVRRNLGLFMYGRYPRDELWRIVVALCAISAYGGVFAGHLDRRRADAGITGPRLTPAARARDLLSRFWPLLLGVLVLLLLAGTATPWFVALAVVGAGVAGRLGGGLLGKRWLLPLLGVGVASLVAVMALLLDAAGWDRWGGLMITILLAVAGIVLCFPLGVLLALGRRAGREVNSIGGGIVVAAVVAAIPIVLLVLTGTDPSRPLTWILLGLAVAGGTGGFFVGKRSSLPLVRVLSVVYIEFFRGVPLYVLLFLSYLGLGFFLPRGFDTPGIVVRAVVVFTLFTAAYLAEIVRGGLQSLPRGQTEAAQALGLGPIRTNALIVLPQALRNVIPSIVGQFISLFKDTTLAGAVMGILELLRTSDVANAQADFAGAGLFAETIPFVMFVFWVGCITMSRESQRLERKLGVGTR